MCVLLLSHASCIQVWRKSAICPPQRWMQLQHHDIPRAEPGVAHLIVCKLLVLSQHGSKRGACSSFALPSGALCPAGCLSHGVCHVLVLSGLQGPLLKDVLNLSGPWPLCNQEEADHGP